MAERDIIEKLGDVYNTVIRPEKRWPKRVTEILMDVDVGLGTAVTMMAAAPEEQKVEAGIAAGILGITSAIIGMTDAALRQDID